MEMERIKALSRQLISTLNGFTTAHSSLSPDVLRQTQREFAEQSTQLSRELDRVLGTRIQKVPKTNIEKNH